MLAARAAFASARDLMSSRKLFDGMVPNRSQLVLYTHLPTTSVTTSKLTHSQHLHNADKTLSSIAARRKPGWSVVALACLLCAHAALIDAYIYIVAYTAPGTQHRRDRPYLETSRDAWPRIDRDGDIPSRWDHPGRLNPTGWSGRAARGAAVAIQAAPGPK